MNSSNLLWPTLMAVAIMLAGTNQSGTRLKEMFGWKRMEYVFENETQRQMMVENGQYVIGNSIPTSIALWTDRLFIATPRLKAGVPSSLSYVYVNLTEPEANVTSPMLTPYPNLDVHDLQQRNITSVHAIHVDNCDRLWALDSGQIENKREIDPAIVIYELKTNAQIDSQKIKVKGEYKAEPHLADILVDVTSSNCDNAFAYISDANNYELLVYNFRTQEFHKVSHNYFHFDPLCGDLTVDAVHYQTQHGLYSLSVSPVGRDDHRLLFFSPLASLMEFSVSTKVVQNKSIDNAKSFYEFKVMGLKGANSQSSASDFDEETGVLFYTLISRNAIGCWNSFSGDEFNEKTQGIITEDKNLIYPSDIHVDKNGLLWTLFNKQPKFLYGTIDPEEINFRVYSGTIRTIIKGTVCDAM